MCFGNGVDILELLGVHHAGCVVSVSQSSLQIGSRGTEGNLGIDLALLHSGECIVEVRVLGIVFLDDVQTVEIHKDDVGVPGEHLLQINVECAVLTGGICQVLCANERKRTVAGFCAFKTVVTFEGNTAHVHRRLFTIGNVLGAVGKVLCNAIEVVGQFVSTVSFAVQLTQNADGVESILIQGGVAAGNYHNGGAGLLLQIICFYGSGFAHYDYIGGDVFYEVKDEKTAHKLIEKRKAQHRLDLIKKGSAVTLDDLFNKIQDGKLKNLDIVLRADVQGSAEAIKSSLEKLSNDEVRVRVIASNTGGITESDVMLAELSNAIIIGFNVRPDANVQAMADKKNVDMRLYRVIYDAIDDVEATMKGMLKPTYKEVIHGSAEVRHIFKVSSVGTIAGSYVKSGKIVRNGSVRVVRDLVVICEAKIESLKREKDDAREVAEGYECGIKLEKFNDIKEGDILECFEMVEEARS